MAYKQDLFFTKIGQLIRNKQIYSEVPTKQKIGFTDSNLFVRRVSYLVFTLLLMKQIQFINRELLWLAHFKGVLVLSIQFDFNSGIRAGFCK